MGLLDDIFASFSGEEAPVNPILAADSPEAAMSALAASQKEDVWRDRIAPAIQAISYSMMTSPDGQPFANMAQGWALARETLAEERGRQSQQVFGGLLKDIQTNAPSPWGPPGGSPGRGGSPAAGPRPPLAQKTSAAGGTASAFGAAPDFVRTAAEQAAGRYGISPDYLTRTAQIESSFDPNAVSPTGARGLWQFTRGTARDYGLTNPFDVSASADAAARLAADNKAYLTQRLGREPTNAELYLAHQQGKAGAAALLSNPDARAGDVVPARNVRVNGGDPNMPAGEFANKWLTKFGGAGPARAADLPAPGARQAGFDALGNFDGVTEDGFFIPPGPQNPILAGLGGEPNSPPPDAPGPLSQDPKPAAPTRRPPGLDELAVITGGARPPAPSRPAEPQGPPQPLAIPQSPPTPAPGSFGTPLLRNPVVNAATMPTTMLPGDPAPLPPARPSDIANPILVPPAPPAQAAGPQAPVTPAAERAVNTAIARATSAPAGRGYQTVAMEDDMGRITYSTVPTGVDRLPGQDRLAGPAALARIPPSGSYASLPSAGGLNRVPATGTVVDDAGRPVGQRTRAGNDAPVQVAQAAGRAGAPAPGGVGQPQPITPQAQNAGAAANLPAPGSLGPRPPSENDGPATQKARAEQIARYWNVKQLQAMALGGDAGKAISNYAQQQIELYAKPYLTPTEHERALAAAGIDPRSAQGRALQLNAFPDSRPASTREYEFYADQETRAGRQPKSFEEFSTSQRRAGATTIDNSQKLQTEFDKGADSTMIKRFSGLVDEGDKAGEDLATVRQLRRTYGAIDTKSLPSARAWLAERGIKIGDDIGAVEAYSALVDRMVPAQRIPGSGTTSDRDLATFKSSLPNLMRTPEGNAMIMDTLEGLSQHRMRRAEISERALLREISPAEAVKQLRALPDPFAAFKASQEKGGGPDRRTEGGTDARPAPPSDSRSAAPAPSPSGASRSVESLDEIPDGAVYKTPNGNVYRRENGRSIFLRKDKP